MHTELTTPPSPSRNSKLAQLAQLMASVALAGTLAACGGGGGSSGSDSTDTSTPSPSPSTSTPSPSPAPADSTSEVTVVTDFFTNIVPNGSNIVVSAWDFAGDDLPTALETAAAKGANVTIITPYGQRSSNASDNAAIVAAGSNAKAVIMGSCSASTSPYTCVSAPMEIHAKFAIVDGIVYMDGHNWASGDVIFKDTNTKDVAAVQTVLDDILAGTATTASAVNGDDDVTLFTTDKQKSLKNESDFLQNVAIPDLTNGTADEYDFIVESYNVNPSTTETDYNDNVAISQCQISQLSTKPKMRLVIEGSVNTNSAQLLQNVLYSDSNAIVRGTSTGQEKISMIRKSGVPVAAWFGSSNSTTTDLYDWGMVTTDSAVLAALSDFFDTQYASSTSKSLSATGTSSTCGTVHS